MTEKQKSNVKLANRIMILVRDIASRAVDSKDPWLVSYAIQELGTHLWEMQRMDDIFLPMDFATNQEACILYQGGPLRQLHRDLYSLNVDCEELKNRDKNRRRSKSQ
jgi:hypothetical protein